MSEVITDKLGWIQDCPLNRSLKTPFIDGDSHMKTELRRLADDRLLEEMWDSMTDTYVFDAHPHNMGENRTWSIS